MIEIINSNRKFLIFILIILILISMTTIVFASGTIITNPNDLGFNNDNNNEYEYIEDEKLRRVCTFDISDTMASRKLKKVLDIKKLVYLDNYDTKKLQKIVQDTCTIVRLSIIELQENNLLPKEHLPENHGNLDEFVYEIITIIYKCSFGHHYENLGENFAESIAFLILDYFDLDTSFCKFNHVKDFNMLDIKTKLVIGCKMQNIVQTFIDFVKEEYNGQIMCA